MMSHSSRIRSARALVLLAATAVLACGGGGSTPRSTAAPPVAVKTMPPIPDLTKARTFTDPIPGLPADKSGITAAQVQRLGDLKYPQSAWDTGLQGWAVYDFVVDADGRVDQKYVRLVAASDDRFAAPAEAAVRAARFTPASQRGKSVRSLVRLPVYFSLDEAGTRR